MGRIGFVTTIAAPWGGSEELWSRSAASLIAQGTQVGISIRQWPEPVSQIEKLSELGCEVELQPRLRRWHRWMGKTNYDWLNRFKPDLLVISNGCQRDGLDWMQACQRRKIPYAIVVQAADDRFSVDDVLADRLAPSYEAAKACYFVSQSNLDFVRRQLAVQLLHGKVVRNPFNVSYNAAPSWPVDDSVFSLACVARLDLFTKAQDVLFDVLREPKWRDRPIRLSLFGEGPNRQTLLRLQHLYGLSNVTFAGFTTNVESIWKTHHALILPSRAEGLPLAIVEAMLCGRMCIVTDVAGNTELLEDNVSGFVATAPSRKSLDEAVERAWQRRSEWQAMGALAARRVRSFVPPDPAHEFSRELLKLL